MECNKIFGTGLVQAEVLVQFLTTKLNDDQCTVQ